jgi:predicted nucleotide-binding protein
MNTDSSSNNGAWQQLQELISLDNDLGRYMQLSFDAFHTSAEWPDLERLQRQLVRQNDPLDLYSVGARIPIELGNNPARMDNRCFLTAAGIALCIGSEEEIGDYLRVLHLAVQKYLTADDNQASPPEITSTELAETLGMADLQVRRIYRMIEWETFIGGGGANADGSWHRQVSNLTRHFVKVATFELYFDAKASLSSRANRVRSPAARPGIGSHLPTAALVIAGPLGSDVESSAETQQTGAVAHAKPERRRVFVVHGRNNAARDAMFAFLRSLGLQPIEWSQAIAMTGEASPYIGKVLDTAFAAAQAVVVLLTPDEIAYLRPEYAEDADDPETKPSTQARPNVLFEAGMAMGRDSSRTVLVEFGQVRPFSDVMGRHAVRLDGGAKSRLDLAQRLETAGCAVDRSGNDWLAVGDLTPPSTPVPGRPPASAIADAVRSTPVSLDLRYHSGGRGGTDRLEIVNLGTETVYKLDLKIPPDASSFSVLSDELPLAKLPAGKSASLLAVRVMGGGSKSHFDVRVTGEMADGTPIAEDVFLSLGGLHRQRSSQAPEPVMRLLRGEDVDTAIGRRPILERTGQARHNNRGSYRNLNVRGCAPFQRASRPTKGTCSAPQLTVAKWLPASCPTLLEKRHAPYASSISISLSPPG